MGLIAQQMQPAVPGGVPPAKPPGSAQGGLPVAPKVFQGAVAKLVQAFTYALQQSAMYKELPQLLQGKDPAKALADLTYNVMHAIVEKIGNVPAEALPATAVQCVSILADLAQSSGAIEKVDEDTLAQAMNLMISRFLRDTKADPAEFRKQLMQRGGGPGGKTAPEGSDEEEATETPEEESAEPPQQDEEEGGPQ